VLENITVAVEDVVTAELIEYTVVETVGPSGCLIRPILPPAYSANHTFTTDGRPAASLSVYMSSPCGFAVGVMIWYSENVLVSGEYLPILLA
jgi:hypothetical protein